MMLSPRNNLFYLLILILFSTSIFAQPSAPPGKKWQKQANLSDTFNSGFNTAKWQKPLWNYGVPVNMKAANSGVSGGNLWIKATLGSGNRWFNTSRVMSKAQIKYPYYTEARIKTAHISAYTTFWLNNGDINNRDEIDIIENNSKPSCNCQPNFPWQMNSQYFHVVNGDTKRAHGNFDNRNLSAGNPLKGVRWNQAYHIVGVWQKDARNIQFYLDGEPAGKVVSARDFTRNMNIIWDLWTGDFNWLGGLAIKSDLNNNNINTMYVDWINTWKLVNDPNSSSTSSTSSSSSTSSTSSSGGSNPLVTIRKGNSQGYALDGNSGGANGQNVQLWSYNQNNVNQRWVEINRGGGFFSYKKENTNYCLDGGGNTSNGKNVYIWTCGSSNQNQQWKKINLGGGKHRLEKRNASAYSIDGRAGGNNGQNVHMWSSNNSNGNQGWIITQIGTSN